MRAAYPIKLENRKHKIVRARKTREQRRDSELTAAARYRLTVAAYCGGFIFLRNLKVVSNRAQAAFHFYASNMLGLVVVESLFFFTAGA